MHINQTQKMLHHRSGAQAARPEGKNASKKRLRPELRAMACPGITQSHISAL